MGTVWTRLRKVSVEGGEKPGGQCCSTGTQDQQRDLGEAGRGMYRSVCV